MKTITPPLQHGLSVIAELLVIISTTVTFSLADVNAVSSATAAIVQVGGHCAIQSHLRSLIFVSINLEPGICGLLLVNNTNRYILSRTIITLPLSNGQIIGNGLPFRRSAIPGILELGLGLGLGLMLGLGLGYG